ncbi:MAG: hypothetical protein EU529_02550 [Promethearchaeota archaeon]|nr:MAG: hypothetical protein EU529_02550 [Candidatus Lokiarchaeota archaeon]
MAMGKTGGILMLVSLFLPVWMVYISIEILGIDISFNLIYWLFGFYIITGLFAGTSVMLVGFQIDIVSLIIFGAILAFSIVAIIKEGTTQMVMGICALGAMAAYLIFFDLGYGFGLMLGIWDLEVQVMPIGGALCLIGASLAIWGGAKTRM